MVAKKNNYSELVTRCAEAIAAFQQPSGAYPASPHFANYQYCWLRDGAFIANSMSLAGYRESAEAFFDWCSRLITSRRSRILHGGRLDARYTYEGKEVTHTQWGAYQLDGFGLWLWALKEHAERYNMPLDKYQEAVDLTLLYLKKHWQEPCFDWWEERVGRHAATLACIYAGLNDLDNPLASEVKKHIKISGRRVDASQLIASIFGAIDNKGINTLTLAVQRHLMSPGGGVHRYKADRYYGGGEWPVTTALMGLSFLKIGKEVDAANCLKWLTKNVQPNGWIAEQSQDHLLHPESYTKWTNQLGPPANPLLWSEAMFITLAIELNTQSDNK